MVLRLSKDNAKAFSLLQTRERSVLKTHEPLRENVGNTFDHAAHLANYRASHRSAQVPLASDDVPGVLRKYWGLKKLSTKRTCANCGRAVENPAEHKVCPMAKARLQKAVAAAKSYRPVQREAKSGRAQKQRKSPRMGDREDSDPETSVSETEPEPEEDDRRCPWKYADEEWQSRSRGPAKESKQSQSSDSKAAGDPKPRHSERQVRPANSSHPMLDTRRYLGNITETDDGEDDDLQTVLNTAFDLGTQAEDDYD